MYVRALLPDNGIFLFFLSLSAGNLSGSSAFARVAKLTAAAQRRAEEIATVNSHVRPNGTKWYTVLSEYGVTDAAAGENAAWGSVSPEEVVNAWMNSEGHRANILDPEARAMGVGYYYNSSSTWGHQWIQLFTK